MDPLPDEIRRFLEANIDSVEQLEILRLLGEDPQKDWAADVLAREVQLQPSAARPHLDALKDRGLITLTGQGAGLTARHGAATPELEAELARLLQVYRERPVTMINLVYARARDALKTFADAFRLKPKEDY